MEQAESVRKLEQEQQVAVEDENVDLRGFNENWVGEEKHLLLIHGGIEEKVSCEVPVQIRNTVIVEPKMTVQQIQYDDTIDNAEDSLSRVLRILNLKDKYPGKLTREDMHQVTKSSLLDEQPKCHEDLAYHFIQNIAKYNCTARECYIGRRENKISPNAQAGQGSTYSEKRKQRAEKNKGLDVSPIDVIIAVFLCCDEICRQDLVSHMWSCRLAVPLVIQDQTLTKQLSFYLWPLRSLVMKWGTQIEGKENIRECRLVNEPMNSIAFIRVGDISLSKSALINSVISRTEKTHSIFFHRNSPGSTRHRYLVNGLVDISWYFPPPESGETVATHFQDAVVFLNLHGDASKLQSHLPMLSNLANILTILCTVKDLVHSRDIVKLCFDQGKAVLIVLTDCTIQEDEEAIIDSFIKCLKPDENRLEFLEVADKQGSDLVQEIRNMLIELSNGKLVSFNDIFKSDMYLDVDEKTDEFTGTMKDAKALSNLISITPYEKRKPLFLPLQGDPWVQWAKADKEKLRNTYGKKNADLQSHIAENVRTMQKCRSKQLEILKQKENRRFMDKFLNSVNKPERIRRLFLRWLQFEMDDLSRKELGPVYEKYHNIMKKLHKARNEDTENLKRKLKHLDDEVALRSFGLEHVLREMGQVYEASFNPEFDLPGLAAEILLDGFPFELLDGYVNNVPLKWVMSVLTKVECILAKRNCNKPVRIKAISALGIQSSGKSTMLNALFGCQYAVSAGRCTRGVYCQFVKVDMRYRQELELDYVLAIDTEGLRAPELSASGQMVQHDNELSAFVIGLGDLTIVNLMGENTTYLEELLPVSVHAFLRMDIATNLKPKCLIVHQNVNKEDKHKLLQQGRVLEDMLDNMTRLACKVERIDMKSFKDIISFDVSADVFYLPTLLEGSPPMSPINTRYSADLNILKKAMLVSTKDSRNKTLESFRNLLQILWSAIKKDDFVYQFRTTIETEARIRLDDYWCKACYEFRTTIRDELLEGYVKIQKWENDEELKIETASLYSQFQQQVLTAHNKQKEAFANFMEHYPDPIIKQTMMSWSVEMERRFDELSRDLSKHVSKKLQEYEDDKRREISVKKEAVAYKTTLRKNIDQLMSSIKGKPISATERKTIFEEKWKTWKSDIVTKNKRTSSNIDIESDAYQAIYRAFPSAADALTKYMRNRSIESYTLKEFDHKEILNLFGYVKSQFTSSMVNEIRNFAANLFHKIRETLESRHETIRPYTEVDIDQIIRLVLSHYENKGTKLDLKPKHGVYLAVLACGHAIKELKTLHEVYESKNSPENLMENEKEHYEEIFMVLCGELDAVKILAGQCCAIIKNGIIGKIKQDFASQIEKKIRGTVVRQSKNSFITELLLELATNGNFDDFNNFIRLPEISISLHIGNLLDKFDKQTDTPLEQIFNKMFQAINADVMYLFESPHNSDGRFMTWMKTFQNKAGDIISLNGIDRLQEFSVSEDFDLDLFLRKTLNCLKSMDTELKREWVSFRQQNYSSLRSQVVKSISEDIIGCTENCPFCGAICDIVNARHTVDHYTKHHRPDGCRGVTWHKTNKLGVETCPESVASDNAFRHDKNDEKAEWIPFKEYKKMYPQWEINKDESGDTTTFWNWYFFEYKNEIANAYNAQVPEIPSSWTLLTRQSEIEKLRAKLN